jgi:hypothetical protein
MSLPMARMCFSAVAPSPISVAPFDRRTDLAVLDAVGLGAVENTNLPLVMST